MRKVSTYVGVKGAILKLCSIKLRNFSYPSVIIYAWVLIKTTLLTHSNVLVEKEAHQPLITHSYLEVWMYLLFHVAFKYHKIPDNFSTLKIILRHSCAKYETCQIKVMVNLIKLDLKFRKYCIFFNPYKPSVLFVGQRHAVQTQIKMLQNAISDQGLHCLLTECPIKI